MTFMLLAMYLVVAAIFTVFCHDLVVDEYGKETKERYKLSLAVYSMVWGILWLPAIVIATVVITFNLDEG